MTAKQTSHTPTRKPSVRFENEVIILNPAFIARILSIVAFVLILINIGCLLMIDIPGNEHIAWFVQIFDVDAELNIPTFFSVCLLLFAALLLAIISVQERKRMAPYHYHWAILSMGFFFMAADELAALHERLGTPIIELLRDYDLGVFSFGWVIPFIPLVIVLSLFFRRFLLHFSIKIRLTFLIAAVSFVSGALGFEMIEGYMYAHHMSETLFYDMVITVEEILEMAGVILFIWGLLVYIADNYGEVRFKVG